MLSYVLMHSPAVEVTASSDNPSGEGLIGLGPNSGSQVYSALGSKSSGAAVVDRIFNQNTSTSNYISVLLGRSDDPDDTFPGDITIGEIISGYDNVTSQPKVEVTSASSSTGQHWQILLDENGILGPDGEPINVTTGVSGTSNKKQLTAVFDTGFSLPQVPQCVPSPLFIFEPSLLNMSLVELSRTGYTAVSRALCSKTLLALVAPSGPFRVRLRST